jgi:hypothetical protein
MSCIEVYLFFRAIVRPFLAGRLHRPGPASISYYPDCIPDQPTPNLSQIPVLDRSIRFGLSKAYSLTYLLEPHAIVRSHLERQSVWSYRDQSVQDSAELLYFGGGSPALDLKNLHRSVYSGWITRHHTTFLPPSN